MGCILKEHSISPPDPTNDEAGKQCKIVSKYPGHTWNADLTAVPISGGFWTYWIPNAICQRWPVCWWVLNVVDHFSRRSVGFAVFQCRPVSEEVTAALDRIMDAEQIRPRSLLTKRPDFKCEHFGNVWCKAKNIRYRFGRCQQARVHCCCRTLSSHDEEILRLIVIPEDQSQFEREVQCIVDWYNESRPHMTFNGKTRHEVYHSRPPANEQSRIEPRRDWPRKSPCANPQVDVNGKPGDPVIIEIDCHQGR